MARTVPIKVYNIGRTMLDRGEVRQWLTDLSVSDEAITKLLDPGVTDCANLVRLAGKRCYMAFEGEGKLNPNVMKVRDDIGKYIDHILESKHGSVIEHIYYNFAIEGISRVLTAELNRHRAGVGISEGSMRFIRFKDLPYWLPTSIEADQDDTADIAEKKKSSRAVFQRAFWEAEANYAELEQIWGEDLLPTSKFQKKKQVTSMMRRIVPIGVSTGGVWTFNFRALRHVCTMRGDVDSAEEEINLLALLLLKRMMYSEIHFFSDFSQNEKGSWQPKHWKV